MNNIKQKLLNCILSFFCIFTLFSCNSNKQYKTALTKPVEIAILMPSSGASANIGMQYSQLIKMGLSDSVQADVNVVVYDGADEKQAMASLDKIIARKTQIILGPLYSPITKLVADSIKGRDIIMITMSNNPALAEDNLFVFGHAPLKQADRIINYFLDAHYSNFISLLPSGQYTKTVNQVLQDMILQKNATLVHSEFYQDSPESIDKAVALVSSSVDKINEMDDVSTKPVIYLSDDPKNLQLLFASISKYNLDKKAVITGDNRIDIDYPEHINIIFTGSLNMLNGNIRQRGKDIGINHMTFLHLMAYDLGRMTGNYIDDLYNKDRFLARLHSKEPYVGISGSIYFVDSIAQRKYDIIKREGGQYSTLSSQDDKSLIN
jgi:hypothetical protein